MEQKEQLGTGLEIAVIGMAVRFPGANNINEFWENLKNGVESIHFFTEEELIETGISPSLLANPNYVKAYGTLGDYEYFDTIFFGYTPKEAEIMDPQVRIFHECSWAALEDAGFAPGTYEGLIGLYAGATPNIDWEARAILAGKIGGMGFFAANQLIQKDFLSMCVSYKLNLKGPSFVLHTACSTSLVAIHLACQGILNGECDMALAGGVSICNLEKGGYIYEEGMISSPDGHCRAFDAGAKGIVGGDGIGIVVLKNLVDAVADRDNIYAVVKGSAINNDGTRRVGFTAPSVAGQAEVIKMAMQAAAVEPESISYIETHGTATELGDPVEIEGLKLAFNTRENGFCGIGSVKTNIGHLGAPAGVAGFIKVILALKHRQIPPTLNFEIPNPGINFVESPFYVNTGHQEWKNNHYPLRAGVSSFGIGGTNAHVIVEEWPLDTKEKIKAVKHRLFLLSARTGPALGKIKENLALYLKTNPEVNLEDVTYTLQEGRRHFNHRWMAVCTTGEEAIAALTSPGAGETHTVSPGEEKHEPLKIQHDAGKDRLMEIGRLWLYGQKIDTRSLYPGEKPYRISLPAYPFEKQKYWITAESIDRMLESGKRIDPEPEISGWFYVPTWKRWTQEPNKSKDAVMEQQWLVFADDTGLGNLLVNRLKETYRHVVVVKRGSSFSQIDNRLFTLNPREYHQYEKLIDMLRVGEGLPGKIIHLWNITGDCENIEEYHPGLKSFEKSQEQGFFSLIHIARALGKQNYSHNIRLYVLTNHVQEVLGNEPANPEKSTILGLLKVIPQEYAGIRCSSIDIQLPQPGIPGEEDLVDLLLEEFTIDPAKMEAEVAIRNNRRWERIFDTLHLETPPQEQLKLRIKQKGVFLITGGLGKIGLMFAELLVKRAGARLIMTGRSPMPSGKESYKIKKLQELEEMGGEVLYMQADVADLEQMRTVINEAEKKFGVIDGIIHAAGVTEGKSMRIINDLTGEDCRRQFQSKVFGVMVLNELFKDKPLDFCWLLSSISCVLGGLGFGAYASANCFMDAYAKKHNQIKGQNSFWLSINWDGMDSATSIDIFERIFTLTKTGQLIVSRQGNLHQRIHRWIKLKTIKETDAAKEEGPSPAYPRPNLSSKYEAPRNPTEKTIAGIWQHLLGFEAVGVKDDFLELGGDSLKAITLISRIQRESGVNIPVTEFFSHPTIERIAVYIRDSKNKSTYTGIEAEEKKEYYLLSSAQLRIYILHRMDIESKGYNIPVVFQLKGNVEPSKLEYSFKKLIKRHESLRTAFIMSPRGPAQVIHDDVEFSVEYFVSNETGVPGILANFIRPFDLETPPLMRIGMIKTGQDKHILILDIFHIVTDGVSFDILLEEFVSIYHQAIANGNESELAPLRIQYKDYAGWQKRLQQVGNFKRQEEYWEKEFEEEIPVLELPVDYARPAIQSFEGNSINFEINNETTSALKTLAQEAGATLYMVLLALYTIQLSRLTGQDEIVIGSPVAGRRHADLEKIIGMFVNTLALRNYPAGEKIFGDFLAEVKEKTLKAFENQDYQYEDLVEKVAITRDTSRNPLFDTMFVLQNTHSQKIDLHHMKFIPYEFEDKTSKFDLSLNGEEIEEKLLFTLEYSTKLFKRETIERFIVYFVNIIRGVVENRQRRISDFEMITQEEKKRVLLDFNKTAAEYPKDKTLQQLFAQQVEQTPDRIAVSGPTISSEETLRAASIHITYIELNGQSDRQAGMLIEKGVQPGTIVAIMMERSVEMIAGILGILKSGGAYLPIDPGNPQERIGYMLKDSNAKILIINKTGTRSPKPGTNYNDQNIDDQNIDDQNKKFGIPFVLKFEHLEFEIESRFDIRTSNLNPSKLAYIIYTSGSTGKPKGVLIRHKGFVNLIYFHRSIFKENQDSRMSQVANPAFDAMGFEVWPCLLSGASLHIADSETRLDPGKIRDWIIRHSITISFQPTVMAEHLLNEPWPPEGVGLKSLCAAGDKLTCYPEQGNPFKLYNLYGPTEDTVWTTWSQVKTGPDAGKFPTIGKPVANHRVYILDTKLNLQPVGLPGELYIGGDGVACGYLNQPELTAEKFDHDLWDYLDYQDFKKGEKQKTNKKFLQGGPGGAVFSKSAPSGRRRQNIYKTGDLARWLPDGNIEFLGRLDHQVKIRGFRIELGEIENHLLNYPGIREAVVVEKKGELCAYIVPHKEPVPGLRDYLAKRLPAYMVPSYFVPLKEIPLTPNGKVDRKALPAPAITPGSEYAAPRNEIERKLVKIWMEVLDKTTSTKIGIDDNFFALGGHSLRGTTLISNIHKVLNAKVSLSQLFKAPTIRKLSQYITGSLENKYTSIEPVEKKEYYSLSSAQKRLYFLQQMDENGTSYNMPLILPLGKNIEINKLESTIKRLIAQHESLRTSFIIVKDTAVQKIDEPGETGFNLEYYDMKEVEIKIEVEEENQTTDNRRQTKKRKSDIHQSSPSVIRNPSSEFIRAFDLSCAPLIRSGIIKHPDQNYTWMVDIHHIISDGTSHTILTENFLSLYNNKPLEPLRLQYKDFSQWQDHLFESGIIKVREDYWLNLYADANEILKLSLPNDYKRPDKFTFAGDNYGFILEKEDAVRFKALGSRNGGTLYMNILAALNTLFYRYTGQTDIIIGTGIAGRPHADLFHIIGMFVNTLAMRNHPQGEKSYESFLEDVIDNSVKAFENQDVQFEGLIDKLDLERDASRNPLFDIMMVVQNFRPVRESGGKMPAQVQRAYEDEKLHYIEYINKTSKFDMTFYVYEENDNVFIDVEYYTAIFKRETITCLSQHLKKLIKQVISNPKIKLDNIDILTQQEKQKILDRFNDTKTDYPNESTIGELYEKQTGKTPDHTAVVFGEEHVTYKVLDKHANQIANYLCDVNRVVPDQPVGMLMDRCISMISALVGILKAGGAYVPISPSFPEERIKHMINDANIKILIGQKQYIKILNRLQWECRGQDTFLCIDSEHIYLEDEKEQSELMSRKLWEYVGETAGDEITGGGWNSSFTGNPIPKKEMDEYGDNILKKLQPLLHSQMRVLEIGCASGISMYRIAPLVGLYYGTDLSNTIIEKNKKRIKMQGHKNIKLTSLAAHEIHQLDETGFDLVIINSVIQCFSGHNYLRKVLHKTLNLLGNKGYIFIGDIMDQDLKKDLIAELVTFKKINRNKNHKIKTDWSEELFISRTFLEDLAWDYPAIQNIKFSNKIYTIENELTKFRYDALIYINKTGQETPGRKKRPKHKHQHDLKILRQYGTGRVNIKPASNNLAYIIYTSGSTGRPKGVMVEHQGLVNYIWWAAQKYVKNERINFSLYSSISFDLTVTSLFTPLITGNEIVIYEAMDKEFLIEKIIDDNRAAVIKLTPSHLKLIKEKKIPGASSMIKRFIVGGENFGSSLARDIYDNFEGKIAIYNEYGPTEAVVGCMIHKFDPGSDQKEFVPIGNPINNTRIYILDKYLNPVPIGVPGEISIGGHGIARGYLNRPEFTSEQFIENPFIPGQKIYKTGDFASRQPDGNIQFIGRIDQQVKIRGHRIEIEEIESRLIQHEEIKDATIIAKKSKNSDIDLWAYLVTTRELTTRQLKEYLGLTLPGYMIPSYFVTLEKMPVTSGGKVDKKMLASTAANMKTGREFVPAQTDLQKKIAGIWQEVLGITSVSITDNFFDLGGNSLKLITLNRRLNEALEMNIPVVEMFRYATIETFLDFIETRNKAGAAPAIDKERVTEDISKVEGLLHGAIGMLGGK